MNCLFGKFFWANTKNSRLEQEFNQFKNGLLDLNVERISSFDFDTTPYFYNKDTKILCVVVGYINNLDEIRIKYKIRNKNDNEVIERLFSLKGKNAANELDGVFSVFIYDENAEKAYLFQDEYGSNLPIYYVNSNKEFIFSTSLKVILKNVAIRKELDYAAVYDLLSFQTMIPNESTLIRDIYKLPPQKIMVFDFKYNSFKIEPLKRNEEKISLSTAKVNLIKSIENNLARLFKHITVERLALALSSGYDSNFILFSLRKLTLNKIEAISVGGIKINEIPQTKLIVDTYKNVVHNTKIIDSTAIDSFPDIVWRIEGYVSESGLFLQYELGKILSERNINTIFLGECADQLLDSCRNSKLEKFKNIISTTIIGDLYYLLFKKRRPEEWRILRPSSSLKKYQAQGNYDIEFDYILKKNGIMLNSFGKQGLYVFINKETNLMSKALGKLNVGKRYYKKQLKKLFEENIRKNISKDKIGGATDIGYLLDKRFEVIIKILQSDFVKKISSESQINMMCNNTRDNCEFILRIVYIYLFNELFISGKYDSRFDQNGIDIPLSKFI